MAPIKQTSSGRGGNKGRGSGSSGRGGGRVAGGRGGGGRGGRGGRGRGRGGGRGGTAANRRLDQLPEYLKAEVTNQNHAYTIVNKDDYNTFENGKMLSDQYLAMADKVTHSLSNKGLPITSHNILSHLLSDITLLKVIEYTNEELARQGQPITNLTEFK